MSWLYNPGWHHCTNNCYVSRTHNNVMVPQPSDVTTLIFAGNIIALQQEVISMEPQSKIVIKPQPRIMWWLLSSGWHYGTTTLDNFLALLPGTLWSNILGWYYSSLKWCFRFLRRYHNYLADITSKASNLLKTTNPWVDIVNWSGNI